MGRQGGTSRRGIRMLILSAATAGLFALGAASAGAATVDPSALDFGSQQVGTTSVPHPVTLTAPCSTPLVASLCTTSVLDTYGVNLTTAGDFGGTTDCPAQLTPVTTQFVSCTIELVFHPSGGGVRTGVLNTGTDVSGLVPGPTVALSGTGVPTTEDGIASTEPRRKKCKRHRKHHRSALSAKKRKCKKKRR
jgi:hypothetical protein